MTVMKGVPKQIRSENGPELVARDLRKWLADTVAKTLYTEPGGPWENGCCENFNSKLGHATSPPVLKITCAIKPFERKARRRTDWEASEVVYKTYGTHWPRGCRSQSRTCRTAECRAAKGRRERRPDRLILAESVDMPEVMGGSSQAPVI